MNIEQFDARNDLEKSLVALHHGELSEELFLQKLIDAQVFMPVRDDPLVAGIQLSTTAKPLVLEAEEGMPVLLLFSSPERALQVVKEYPGYGGGLLVEFRWVLERAEPGCGVSINPSWEIGYDIEPDVVASLMEAVAS